MTSSPDQARHAGSPVDILLDLQAPEILIPLDEACIELAADERLRLFLQLTDRVVETHRQLRLQPGLEPRRVRVTAAPPAQVRMGRGKLWGPDAAAARPLGELRLLGDPPAGEAASPAFLSPEQLRGGPLTTASDIYRLGALLYVVCTGPLPAAAAAGPAWPSGRQRLPGDLEPILSKAMAMAPEQRYRSADALAADLRACLAGKPVSVCDPTPRYLAARFLQRHRLPSLVAGAGLAALVLAFATSAWQVERAYQARAIAEARLQAMRATTRDVVLRYGDAVHYLPGNMLAKQGLLTGLQAHLEALEREGAGDPEWLSLLVAARARLAQVQANDTGSTLDHLPEARRNAQRAIVLGDGIWAARQHDPDFVAAYALALQVRGEALRAAGGLDDSRRDLAEALRRVEEALSAAPEAGRRPLRLQHAALQLAQARGLETSDAAAQALAAYDRAEVELRALASNGSPSSGGSGGSAGAAQTPAGLSAELPVRVLLGNLHAARAIAYTRLDQLDRARDDAQAAFRLRESTAREEPYNPAWRDALATAAGNYAVILLRLNQPGPALQASEVAWTELQSLARENGPHNPWIAALARTAQHHGRALVANGRYAEALPVLARATTLWEATLRREPGPQAQRTLARLLLDQARALQGTGDPAAARLQAQRVIAALAPLAEQAEASSPGASDTRVVLAEACSMMETLAPRRGGGGSAAWPGCGREASRLHG